MVQFVSLIALGRLEDRQGLLQALAIDRCLAMSVDYAALGITAHHASIGLQLFLDDSLLVFAHSWEHYFLVSDEFDSKLT